MAVCGRDGGRCRLAALMAARRWPLARRAMRLDEEIEDVPQRGEVVERQASARLRRRPQGTDVEIFSQLAEELGLLDAVDAQVGFQIGIQSTTSAG